MDCGQHVQAKLCWTRGFPAFPGSRAEVHPRSHLLTLCQSLEEVWSTGWTHTDCLPRWLQWCPWNHWELGSLSAGTKLGIFKRASGGLFHHLKGKVNDPLGPPCMFLEPREKGEKQTMKSSQSWGWKDSKNLCPQNNYSCTCLLHTGAVTCWVSGPGAWWSIYFPKAQHLMVVHPFLFLSLAVLLVFAKKWKEGYLEAFK